MFSYVNHVKSVPGTNQYLKAMRFLAQGNNKLANDGARIHYSPITRR